MSRNWAGGSTTAWRRTRAAVLARDSHRCRLQLAGCTTRATTAHHTLPRSAVGDDPRHLVAACASCNGKVGDPSRSDPAPRARRQW